jgi:ankyrin repeat protein
MLSLLTIVLQHERMELVQRGVMLSVKHATVSFAALSYWLALYKFTHHHRQPALTLICVFVFYTVHCALQIDGQTAQGSTALMLACKRGHTEVVRVLLTAGAEINIKDT